MKRCPDCGERKPREQFGVDGVICDECLQDYFEAEDIRQELETGNNEDLNDD